MGMVRIAVRIPQSLADELTAEARAIGLPLSWAVRRRLSGRGVEIVAATGRKCKDTLSREAGGIQLTKSENVDVTAECKSRQGPFDSATHKQVSSPAAPTEEPEVLYCRIAECGKAMIQTKGWWVCPDVGGCPMGGIQQKKVVS